MSYIAQIHQECSNYCDYGYYYHYHCDCHDIYIYVCVCVIMCVCAGCIDLWNGRYLSPDPSKSDFQNKIINVTNCPLYILFQCVHVKWYLYIICFFLFEDCSNVCLTCHMNRLHLLPHLSWDASHLFPKYGLLLIGGFNSQPIWKHIIWSSATIANMLENVVWNHGQSVVR